MAGGDAAGGWVGQDAAAGSGMASDRVAAESGLGSGSAWVTGSATASRVRRRGGARRRGGRNHRRDAEGGTGRRRGQHRVGRAGVTVGAGALPAVGHFGATVGMGLGVGEGVGLALGVGAAAPTAGWRCSNAALADWAVLPEWRVMAKAETRDDESPEAERQRTRSPGACRVQATYCPRGTTGRAVRGACRAVAEVWSGRTPARGRARSGWAKSRASRAARAARCARPWASQSGP